MKLWIRVSLYAVGLILLGTWIGTCAAGFWFILQSTPQGISDSFVASLAWPFAAVLIAVPAIGVLLVGGLHTLGQVVSLKAFLQELPQQVGALEKLSAQIDKQRDSFQRMKSDIEDAAGTIDLTSSQLADFQASLDQLRQANGQPLGGALQGGNLASRLAEHLTRAKEIFDQGAQRYEQEFDEGIERARGWILETSVRELKDSGKLNAEQAAYVTAALDVDRKTRRAGRRNLEQADIARLDALSPNNA